MMQHEGAFPTVDEQPGLEELAALREQIDELRQTIEGDLWAGGTILRGELPRTPIVDALPAPGEAYGYRLVTLKGDGSTTPDITYVCLRDSSAVWAWRSSATG